MLVTSKTGLERLEPGRSGETGSLVPSVDMTPLILVGWNEVVIDRRGNAYVNSPNFDMSQGFDFELGFRSGVIAVVTPEDDARLVADAVAFPNGMAVTADGSTLIVAESFASRLGAWDIQSDGSLSNRRVWALLEDGVDGICIDAEGAVWCATQRGCVTVREGGEVTHSIRSACSASRARSGAPKAGRCSWSPTSGTVTRTSARVPGPAMSTWWRSTSRGSADHRIT
jgi:sugar lactone lactonase YvrE